MPNFEQTFKNIDDLYTKIQEPILKLIISNRPPGFCFSNI